MLKKKIYGILLTILIILAVLFLSRFIIQQYRKIQAEKNNAISMLVTYELNGENQTVLIEGKSADLPILVMLHGGPCFSIPFNEGCRGMFPEITEEYLTVYWDQLGCGLNRSTYEDGTHLPAGISAEDYKIMLKDLLVALRADYPDREVYLFGISWGSILTADIAANHPELIDGCLVYGQVRGYMFQTEDVINAILEQCTNEEDAEFLRNCLAKESLTDDEIFHVESLLAKYTDGFIYHGRTGPKQSYGEMIGIFLSYLVSPDYSLRDAVGTLTDCKGARCISIEMLHTDFSDTIRQVQVPYTILQGDVDLQTSRTQIQELVETSDNPNLTIEIVPNCGHIPTSECFEVIIDAIIDMKNS